MTPADQFANELLALKRQVQTIRPLSRTQPHIFAEQKDEIARELDKLATRARHQFAGLPARTEGRSLVDAKGRTVRVERRRAAA